MHRKMSSPEETAGPPDYGMQLATDLLGARDNEKTFQYQDSLPSLPVPELSSTLDTYLKSVKPLVTEEEYQRTRAVVEDFANGVGQTLQRKLQEKAAGTRNWLAEWWEDYAYLMTREPGPPLANFLCPAPFHMFLWPPQEGVQCERAALVTWFILKFWKMLRRESMRVDRGFGGVLWCMHQYLHIFNSCKTPGLHKDKLNYYFKTVKEGDAIAHIIVACKGRLFKFKVTDDAGDILTAPELETQFKRVRDTCERGPWGPGIGILTSEHRVTWYEMRLHLMQLHPDNERYFKDIESSILLTALDERSPGGYTELSIESQIGEGRNRWYDKGLTIAVMKNGLIGSSSDHSSQDGVVNISHVMWTLLGLQRCGGQWQGTKQVCPLPDPEELAFKVDEIILQGIDDAATSLQQRESNIEILNKFFKPFGKTYLRQQKLHPDSFVQVVIQYTYYRIYRRPAPTYETATIRKFYKGRTETIRSCTMEALEFSKAMLDPNTLGKERLKLMHVAMQRQIQQNTDCTNFKGCDRHLLGLQIAALEDGMEPPEIFTDPAYTKSGGGGNYTLSTSFAGHTPVYGGTAPMCKDGIGCYYSIPPNCINFYLTCWKSDKDTSCAQFYDALEKSLLEAKALLDEHGPVANL